MKYRWMGRKPLVRSHNVYASTTGRGRDKAIGIETEHIALGDAFDPTPAELHSFRDLLEPVGASLRTDAADAEGEKE